MSKNQFVHLHVHSDYSLLNGMCRINDIARFAKTNNMPAVALTDHGNMGGVMELVEACHFSEIKPIIGCEVYLSPTTRFDTEQDRIFHLILLAKNHTGYQNLCRIVSSEHLEGFHNKPCIDKQILSEYSEGVIALSGCIKGEISLPILEDRMDDAKRILNEYLDIFGRDNFYLELTDHGMPIQKIANNGLITLGKEFDVKVVASNDVHYLEEKDAKAHDLLRCIKNNTNIHDKTHRTFSGNEYYLKTANEMAATFADIPEAITNTLEIAEKCNVIIPLDDYISHWPVYEVQSGDSSKEYLRNLCIEGFAERYKERWTTEGGCPTKEESQPGAVALQSEEKQRKIIDRMDYELRIFDENNFNDYFLIVHDIIRYAKKKNIPVGPGHGSVGGSLVCYLLEITDIDPIRYDLCFERFINPERVFPPEIELDICDVRRYEIFEYVYEKYSRDKVANIATYPTFRGAGLLKTVAEALGRSSSEQNRIKEAALKTSTYRLPYCLEENQELQQLLKKEEWAQEVFDYALQIEGIKKGVDADAAGIIIGDQQLKNIVPLFKGDDGKSITQYEMRECACQGLLILEFLGLKTLTMIQCRVDKIRSKGNDIDIAKIPMDDKKTFGLLNKGDTDNVFQLESPEMQDLCRELGVESIKDIIAIITLYRPGVMHLIPEFIARKHGKFNIEYTNPRMEPILKETYGIMLYQDQIIEVIHQLSGFSRGKANLLRKAKGKQKTRELEELYDNFIKGCISNGMTEAKIEKFRGELWDASGRAANKAHAVAYATLAYKTAYLKANYLLSSKI